MKKKAIIPVILVSMVMCVFLSVTRPVFCFDYTVWIKSTTCWIVGEPNIDAVIVGIILQKSAVQVEDASNGWLKIVDPFAPCKDPQTSEFIDCKGYYIQKNDTTTIPPGRW